MSGLKSNRTGVLEEEEIWTRSHFKERRTQGEDVLISWEYREKTAIYKPRREVSGDTALSIPWSQTVRLHNWEKTTFYWISLPPCGTLLWWLNQVHGWPNKHLGKTFQEWLEDSYGEFHCVAMAHSLTLHFPRGGEGNGNPFQDSCLENPVDKGAW